MTGRALKKLNAILQKCSLMPKKKYFTDLREKLFDPSIGIKAYWRTLHNIINKNQVINIPTIYPIKWCVYYKFSKRD